MSLPVDATGAYTPMQSAAELVDVLDKYLADLKDGRPPDRPAILAAHPALAGQLDSCLAALEFIHRAELPGAADAPAVLGDFRIVREIGRGGMGVVYEAEQQSLKRRVALKVLRFGGGDTEAMRRFQREAETVARLHHTNIVPIFAVGCEQGTHYYAMQFIAGRSLAEASKAGQGRDLREAARWGVQAAEALAYAHARGVIHRDVKPSNLLLDDEGTVWLTDFGLARCTDELTMTATGMLLGTPRYVSPEQASVVSKPVDARSDVYSLGASLYELATGKPVYDGETLQRLLAQIRDAEPTPPRRHRPDLPRDLETVLMKCLEKEPSRRYASAQELADDLRRFAAGDPIKARRPGPVERAARWWRKRKGSAALAVASAAAAGLILLAGGLTWQRYDAWRQGRLFLASDGTATTAELFRPDGTSAGPPFSLQTEEPLALPAGDYQLRLRGRGFLDETFRVRVERGTERAFDVSLSDQRLWEPLAVSRCYELAAGDGRTDVLVLSGTGVARRHGGTGAVLWEADLRPSADPKLAGFRWDWDSGGTPTGRGDTDRRPGLMAHGPDLIWVSRRQAAVLALSGSDGKVLWCYQAAPPPFGKDTRFNEERASTGAIIGLPVRCDVDGTPALVVTGIHQTGADGAVPRWVAALSAAEGKLLWRYDLPADWFNAPAGQAVPDSCRWPNLIGLASSSSSASFTGLDMLYEKDFNGFASGLPAPYPAEMLQLADKRLIAVGAGTRLLLLDPRDGRPVGNPVDLGFWPVRAPQFADLDGDGRADALLLGPGDQSAPAAGGEVGFIPDGPKAPLPETPVVRYVLNGTPRHDRLTLTAVAPDTGRVLWKHGLRGYWGWHWSQEPFGWPLVADLDGDGKPEIVVPTGEFAGETKWAGVELRDGATGAVRWQRTVERSSRFGQLQQVNRVLVGPDLDGDGCRDLFTAVLDGVEWSTARDYSSIGLMNFDKDYNKPVLRIDALSGRDGHGLWWSAHPVRSGSLTTYPHPYVGPPGWWHAGPDGWPLLVVPYIGGTSPAAYVVSSGSGKLWHVSPDMPDPRPADLDGDGVPDLLSFRPERVNAFDRGGTLETVRGRSPEAWRQLGGRWAIGPDFDGDGIPDLITAPRPDRLPDDDPKRRREAAARPKSPTDKDRAEARSGRDGRLLWRAEITDGKPTTNWEKSRYQLLTPAGCDLDGDGVPDLLATIKTNMNYMNQGGFPPVVAVSGRTGERIWACGFQVEYCNGPQLLACHDLDGDGKPEVLTVFASDWDFPRGENRGRSTNDWQYWLAVLDGATGRLKWRQPLSEPNGPNQSQGPARTPFAFAVVDLDGDRRADIVVEGGLSSADGDVRAFRGRDGEPLWTWKPAPRPQGRGYSFCRPTIAVGDLDGDGKPEVVLLHTVTQPDAKPGFDNRAEVVALDGRTGAPRWSWRRTAELEFNDTGNGAVKVQVAPLLVRRAGGKTGVCVWTFDYDDSGVVTLLDETGREAARRSVAFRLGEDDRRRQREKPRILYSPIYSDLFRVWTADLDGDGADELLVFEGDKLLALRSDLQTIVWEHPLPDAACDLLRVLPGGPALRLGGRVVGLDGKTGRPAWSCAGSGTPLAILTADAGLPRVVFDLGDEATVCRRAMPAGDAAQAGGFAPYEPTQGDDPRFVRPLPWNALTDRPPLFPPSPFGIFLWLAWLGFAAVVPLWLLRQAVRWRSVRPALAAVAWTALVWAKLVAWYWLALNDDAVFQTVVAGYRKFATGVGKEFGILALAGLPAFVFLAVGMTWLVQRRWTRVAWLVGATVLLAGVIGTIWVRSADPGEGVRFATRGWWGVAPAGAYAAGALLTVGWLVRTAWGWWKGARRVRK
jgi:aminoglycoside phosphotransferase (APT) family kinase protein